MDEADVELRNATYARFVALGRAPSVVELATELGRVGADVTAGWRRLHDAHALVLNQQTDEIRMANPFRSEEHIDAWLAGRAAGATFTVVQLCDLAHRWWGDRLDRMWRPHTREQNQAILDGLGLTGAFWQLG